MAERSKDTVTYPYPPSLAAAIIALVVFGILLIVHAFRLLKTRTWFCIPFVLGAIFEFVGYGARAVGISSRNTLGLYIVQTLLILLAPILFAASVYMFLGRIIVATGLASYSMIRPTRLTKVFVGGDVLCFLIQAMGGAMLTNAKDKKATDLGQRIILVGLFLQIVIFGFFIVVGAVFHRRARQRGKETQVTHSFLWEKHLNTLYVVSVIITMRNLFRVIEFAMGEKGYLLAHEWPLYVFDALPMSIVLGICCLWYVGDVRKISQQQSNAFEMIRDTQRR